MEISQIRAYLQSKLDEWNALGERKFEPENAWGYNFIMACFDDLRDYEERTEEMKNIKRAAYFIGEIDSHNNIRWVTWFDESDRMVGWTAYRKALKLCMRDALMLEGWMTEKGMKPIVVRGYNDTVFYNRGIFDNGK